MDNSVLKKRLNTYKSSEGKLRNVSDEVVMEVLRAWENWPGTTADLYRELGLTKMQMVIMIKKGKKLVKSGVVVDSEFHEVSSNSESSPSPNSLGNGIKIAWQDDKIIRFSQVDQLIDFLKKVA